MSEMDRRNFMQASMLGVAGLAVAATTNSATGSEAHAKPTAATGADCDVDVLVVGGGTAGVVAAVQAGRMGAKTLLVERNSQLGGTMTTGGVNFPGLFHAWGKQLIAGIGWELVTKTVAMEGGRLPDFSVVPKHHPAHQVTLNAPLYALLAEQACVDAGVAMAYYQYPNKVIETENGWQVEIAGQGVNYQVRCRQIIDCTGNATLVGMAGFERMRGETRQPGTMVTTYKGFNHNVIKKNSDLVRQKYKEWIKAGKLKKGDTWSGNPFQALNRSGNNNHIFGADSSTAATQTQANLDGRKCVMRILTFLRSLPGGERTTIDKMMTEAAIRETYRIKGETVVTVDDYTNGRTFDDAVCYSFYPIDLHDAHGVKPKKLTPGTYPTIPRSALIPKGSKNMMVAGRCLSSDRLANSAARVQASCMAMGQATGVIAALAAKQNTTPSQVALSDIHSALAKHDAVVIGQLRDVSEVNTTTSQTMQDGNMLVDAASAVAVGSWTKSSTSVPFVGNSYLHDNNDGKGQKSLTFTTKVDAPGKYSIKLYYSAHESRASNVPVTITIGDKVQELKVNQQKSDGEGFVLGSFDIQDEVKIVVSNAGTSGFVIVDGLKFSKK